MTKNPYTCIIGTSAWNICMLSKHDDVIKWKHFPRNWPFVRGIHWSRWIPPTQRPVTRSFDVFFDLYPNKWLSKQWRRWWFKMPSRSLWRHCNGMCELNPLWLNGAIGQRVIASTNVDFSLLRFCGIHLRTISQATILYNEFQNYISKITTTSPMVNMSYELIFYVVNVLSEQIQKSSGNMIQLYIGYGTNTICINDAIWWQIFGQHWLRWWLVAWWHQAIN